MTVQKYCCWTSIHFPCLRAIWFVSSLSLSLSLPVICLPPLHTRKPSHTDTHTRRPHVFLAGALAVVCPRSRTTRNWWERKFHELVSRSRYSRRHQRRRRQRKQAAVTAAAPAAFAVSSSAAAVTIFFLRLSWLLFSCFCLCPPFHCGYATAVAFPFPITSKRFHVCLTHLHTHLFCVSQQYLSISLFSSAGTGDSPLPISHSRPIELCPTLVHISCLIVIIACE